MLKILIIYNSIRFLIVMLNIDTVTIFFFLITEVQVRNLFVTYLLRTTVPFCQLHSAVLTLQLFLVNSCKFNQFQNPHSFQV